MVTRTEILSAIKQTVDGGRALGEDAFSAATGIKQHEWRKFWVRWSEAVREAGFQPNTLTQKYSDEILGTQLATLARELGKMPVKGDIDHRKIADANFPSYVAYRRWKRDDSLASALWKFCQGRNDLSDVAAFCQPSAKPPSSRTQRVVNGYVYLFRYGNSGRDYKVGKTENPARRHSQLSGMFPGQLRVIHVIETDDPGGIEGYWKGRFESKRLKGKDEIFRLDPADIAAFKSRKYQ